MNILSITTCPNVDTLAHSLSLTRRIYLAQLTEARVMVRNSNNGNETVESYCVLLDDCPLPANDTTATHPKQWETIAMMIAYKFGRLLDATIGGFSFLGSVAMDIKILNTSGQVVFEHTITLEVKT